MWIATTRGFYSVVEHRDDPGRLIVRARVREDLEALRDHIPNLRILRSDDADYRFRAIVDRPEWIVAVAMMSAAIDYPNFKAAVGDRHGGARAGVYAEVWSVLRRLQEDGSRVSGRSPRRGTAA